MENEVIKLPARYGYIHTLEHLSGNLWQFHCDPKSSGTYRLIGFEHEPQIGQYVSAFDPEGGPFMGVDSELEGYIIKTIQRNGVFELIKKQ